MRGREKERKREIHRERAQETPTDSHIRQEDKIIYNTKIIENS